MNPQQVEQLQSEVIKGDRASFAYSNFIHDFVEKKKIQLYNLFLEAPLNESEVLLEVKRQMMVLKALDDEILKVIETGKMAYKQLSDNEKLKH